MLTEAEEGGELLSLYSSASAITDGSKDENNRFYNLTLRVMMMKHLQVYSFLLLSEIFKLFGIIILVL